MLTSWFGATEAHSDTEHQDLSTDGTLKTVDISTRRTEQEVLKLVRTFQRVFDGRKPAKKLKRKRHVAVQNDSAALLFHA